MCVLLKNPKLIFNLIPDYIEKIQRDLNYRVETLSVVQKWHKLNICLCTVKKKKNTMPNLWIKKDFSKIPKNLNSMYW